MTATLTPHPNPSEAAPVESTVLVERHERTVLVRLNRPSARNALDNAVMNDLMSVLTPLDRDPTVGCFVITGSADVFAAGADIKEMRGKSAVDMFVDDHFAGWDGFAALRTPRIAAVAGYALGGGCELAMMCDLVFAAESARFGQPELSLGVVPGMGGSQRLTHLVGRSMAMDMILTGRTLNGEEAVAAGLASRVVQADRLLAEALDAADTIASFSKPSVMVAREAVDRALEVGLREGILFERRTFHALFATADQTEGMEAFVEKRTPEFSGR